MTGKEALINLSKTCMAYQEEFGRLKIDKKDNEALQVLLNIVQKYDKYKRAFEILKRHNLSIGKNANTETGYYIHCESELLTDECELLEELMKGEEDKKII